MQNSVQLNLLTGTGTELGNINKNNTEQNNNDNNNKKQKQQQETIKSTKMKMIKCFHSVWHSL